MLSQVSLAMSADLASSESLSGKHTPTHTFEAKVEKVEITSAGEEPGACVIRASA